MPCIHLTCPKWQHFGPRRKIVDVAWLEEPDEDDKVSGMSFRGKTLAK